MEKVTLYVKKILALIFSLIVYVLVIEALEISSLLFRSLVSPPAFLLFAFLNFRITGDKPKFLFGLTQSDAFLTKKGGFWNLFKWIVNALGFLYDLIVWAIWGVVLLFMLVVDFIMLIKFIVYWIIHAIIWFIRQLFPPFIFMFKMFIHYIINWCWWIYQMAFRNMRISVNKNFYFIALWGTIPALFIVFLFYAIAQLVGIPELVAVSGIFALIPLVWSFGEIASLRYEKREKDDYGAVKGAFRNGWDAVKSAMFYLIIFLGLLIVEIVLNLVGWIPNLSMSLLGITLNLNMAISFVLVFLAVIVTFVDSILPSHILYHPEHENDFNSSLGFLKVIGQKFIRYILAQIPMTFFGGLLLVIPVLVMLLTFNLTETIKNGVMDVKIENLNEKLMTMEETDVHRTQIKIDRIEMYKGVPLNASGHFEDLGIASDMVRELKENLAESEELLVTNKVKFDEDMAKINAAIELARVDIENPGQFAILSNDRLTIEEDYLEWDNTQKENITYLQIDLKEERSFRAQMPILYFFVGIFFAVFAGMVLAVFIAYAGNVSFELYNMKEDDKPTVWRQTITELQEKDGNQPLLGFTFLVVIGVLIWLFMGGDTNIF